MHIPPHDNHNSPIIDVDDARVPLNYFNIVKLRHDQSFEYQVPRYETAVVPATGTCDVSVGGEHFAGIGNRGIDVWVGEPEAVYAPSGAKVRITCVSDQTEVFIAGARFEGELTPFAVRAVDIDKIQYGSDETKTHRKIKHILGTKYHGRVGRLLVSELFTVGLSAPQARYGSPAPRNPPRRNL
jgi:5-deoxy-glucuronate isomerase